MNILILMLVYVLVSYIVVCCRMLYHDTFNYTTMLLSPIVFTHLAYIKLRSMFVPVPKFEDKVHSLILMYNRGMYSEVKDAYCGFTPQERDSFKEYFINYYFIHDYNRIMSIIDDK
jgi:hypothetical protein